MFNAFTGHADDMCRTEVFQAADRLWQDFLQQAAHQLLLPDFAIVLTGLADTAAGVARMWHIQQSVRHHEAS